MIFSFLRKKLNDISISRKLYFTVGIMALLITIELCTLWFAVNTLSSVRSFVAGEGLWSKAEKDAVLRLHMYAYTHQEKDYQTFLELLEVPAGDRTTRLELQKANPDMAVARKGFLDGGNHPDDIAGMIKLLQRFHDVSYLKKAFTLWANAEPIINDLIKTGHSLHGMITTGAPQKDIDQALLRMTLLNQRLSIMENGFSYTLGEGARWLEGLVLSLLLGLSLTIGSTSIIITISVSKNIEKGLNEIIHGADLISNGLLHHRVQVFSNDEIGILATAFNQMTDKLELNLHEIKDKEEKLSRERSKAEASEKVKQLFLMNMSHEIRTPMNAILGFARLLVDLLDDEEQQEYLQLLISAGDELLVIMNDILDFSKMESGMISLETMPFNLKAMVEQLTDEMRSKATIKDISLSYYVDQRIPEVIIGDGKRLQQVLVNLLANAIKFTDRGDVRISVYEMNEYSRHIELEFSVKDTGIGIADEYQEKIFERFEQAVGGIERRFGGTGLGLSIVKQLVELQGGKVYVNSTPGRGSEFHFRISFLKVKPTSAKDNVDTAIMLTHTHAVGNKGPRILVVDDNPANRMLVIRILQKNGFEIDFAENGKICLEKFDKNKYDLVLMDLQMPEMDGYEAAKRIRSRGDDKRYIPIVAMTAHTLDGEKERCLALGMNGFVPKPFHPDFLCEKINEVLQ